MEIRILDPDERIRTRALYEAVFPEDSASFVDYYYTEKIKDNEIYVGIEEGEIVSMLHLNPYTLLVNGQEKPAHYIVAVATLPAYRHRGYMRALLTRALTDMAQAGEAFTFLMPVSEALYAPYDFCTVYEQKRQRYEAADGTAYRQAVQADCPALAAYASKLLFEQVQVYARRDTAYYERLLKEMASDGGALMVSEESGVIRDVREAFPETEMKETEPARIMVRILQVQDLLSSMTCTGPVSVCFCLTDPILPENHRCVCLSGTAEGALQVTDANPKDSEGTIPLAALTRLLFGRPDLKRAPGEAGANLSAHMQAELKKICPLSRIFLNEVV